MTRLTRASRVARGQGSLRRLTLLMSACTTTVLRLIARPGGLVRDGLGRSDAGHARRRHRDECNERSIVTGAAAAADGACSLVG
jgi:hypothetical protein